MELDRAMSRELRAYRCVAEQAMRAGEGGGYNDFVMELHGVFQDGGRVFYAMVRFASFCFCVVWC